LSEETTSFERRFVSSSRAKNQPSSSLAQQRRVFRLSITGLFVWLSDRNMHVRQP